MVSPPSHFCPLTSASTFTWDQLYAYGRANPVATRTVPGHHRHEMGQTGPGE